MFRRSLLAAAVLVISAVLSPAAAHAAQPVPAASKVPAGNKHKVVGKLAASAPGDATAIPWLLLPAAATTPGALGDTTFIQRVNTTGGLAPAAATCTTVDVGTQAEVPYTADYHFWKAKGCARDEND